MARTDSPNTPTYSDYWAQGTPSLITQARWAVWEKTADQVAQNAGFTDRHDPQDTGFVVYMMRAADRAVTADDDGTEYVNVYEVDRGYGGPEEGGWYYDAGTIVESRHVLRDSAEDVRDKLVEKYESTGDSNSVNYRGGDYRVYIEDEAGKDYPDYTPNYE